MSKRKRKLTAAEKRARKLRREQFMTIFIHGKQKRVKRPQTIDGMDVDEFIRNNADPIWLHQNEMWEYMMPEVPRDISDVGDQSIEDWDACEEWTVSFEDWEASKDWAVSGEQ